VRVVGARPVFWTVTVLDGVVPAAVPKSSELAELDSVVPLDHTVKAYPFAAYPPAGDGEAMRVPE